MAQGLVVIVVLWLTTRISEANTFFLKQIIYILVRICYFYSTFTAWVAVKYITTTGITLYLGYQLQLFGTPRYQNGILISPGNDLAAKGLTE